MALLRLVLWAWQLPQNLLGAFWGFILEPGAKSVCLDRERDVRYIIVPNFRGGVSLGRTVIVNRDEVERPLMWRHEYGHCRQSQYLGCLYLLVIGIPSAVWALIYNPKWRVSYYAFYTERWADKLGGIKR